LNRFPKLLDRRVNGRESHVDGGEQVQLVFSQPLTSVSEPASVGTEPIPPPPSDRLSASTADTFLRMTIEGWSSAF